MAWSDPTALKFDVSKITSMRSKLQTTATELSELSTTLLAEVETLKQSWNTPAGEVFIEKFDTGWAEEVKKYVEIIDAVDQLLAVAEANYSDVEEAVNAITF